MTDSIRLYGGTHASVKDPNRATLDLTRPGIVAPEEILPAVVLAEAAPMDGKACRQYASEMRQRYQKADRAGRSRLLDEFTAVTGYHRKYAIALLATARIAPL